VPLARRICLYRFAILDPPTLSHEMPMKHLFQVIVEQDEEGRFVAECPAFKACYTQGKTYEEAVARIKDVIVMCLHELEKKGRKVPRQTEIIGVKRIEIAR